MKSFLFANERLKFEATKHGILCFYKTLNGRRNHGYSISQLRFIQIWFIKLSFLRQMPWQMPMAIYYRYNVRMRSNFCFVFSHLLIFEIIVRIAINLFIFDSLLGSRAVLFLILNKNKLNCPFQCSIYDMGVSMRR